MLGGGGWGFNLVWKDPVSLFRWLYGYLNEEKHRVLGGAFLKNSMDT